MQECPEQDCVERAKQGEPAAIAELYRRYWRAARGAAYGVTGDFPLAEDAASEAFYAAIEGLHELRDAQRFGPWLRTIVIRNATKSKARSIKPPRPPDLGVQSPSEKLEQQELAVLIHEAVGTLDETYREALSLFYFEGYNLKEAAGFLDIPAGTLKRRLHEARQHLRDAAEQILKGAKPANPQRQQILQQLRDAADEGIQSQRFYEAIRQALRLRPVPDKLLKEIMKKHWSERRAKVPITPEKARKVRELLARTYKPSARAQDPNHPVGAVADAIRAALPQFQPWQIDWSAVDFSRIVHEISQGDEKALSFLRPPGFIENPQGSYISSTRAFLVLDEDGSFRTPYELMQRKDSMAALKTQITQGKRVSDVLRLLWKKSEPLELRAVENLLRRLSQAIIPATPARFCAYQEPRFRAALRMQLGDNPIPAAIGGVRSSVPGLPDDVTVACVDVYLEPWAAAQSGQVIELADVPSPADLLEKGNQ
jgi:RNA polymerase sigma-70 factor (ECF subfamily)